MKRIVTIFFFVLLPLASACGSDDSTDADAGAPDATSTDAAAADMSTSDGGPSIDDGGTTDAESDPDGGEPDDGGTSDDAGTQMDVSDPDADSTGACASDYAEVGGIDGVIIACEGAAESIDQCDAVAACGDGWHMCTATEFRAQYESTEPPGVLDANFWIASCIRDGGGPQSPSDEICSDCTGTATGPEADVAFSCVNSISIVTESSYVGVRAAGSCQFAGNGNPGNDAYWSASPASTLQAGAFCCPD